MTRVALTANKDSRFDALHPSNGWNYGAFEFGLEPRGKARRQ
jgi:hypothetical protein